MPTSRGTRTRRGRSGTPKRLREPGVAGLSSFHKRSSSAASRRSPAARSASSAVSSRDAIRASAPASPSPPKAACARRARSSRSSATAAWFAKTPSRSISASVKRESRGLSSTSKTPSARSSASSGTAISPRGTYPVLSAASREKRGSSPRSSITSGCRVTSTQPAMPVLEGKRFPISVPEPSPATASNTSSSASSSRRNTDDAFAPKIARAVSTTDCSSVRNDSSAPSTPAATAARSSSLTAAAYVRRDEVEDILELKRDQLAMLGHDQRADPGDVRGREAVARAAQRLAAEPRDVDLEPAREELDGRRRVVVVRQRVVLLVASDGDHRGEAPREALDRHVVRGRDEHRASKIRRVGQLVQRLRELPLRRREAHVDHVEALLDGPLEAREQDRAAAGEPGAEHADARQLAVGRERADDPGAGGAVAAQVSLRVRLHADLVTVAPDRPRVLHVAHNRVRPLDPAVEDPDAHAVPRRAAPRPLACDALRPLGRQRDPLGGLRRQAPRRELLAL